MRVLHSIFSVRPETGGPARSAPSLVSSLQRAGADVRLNICEKAARRKGLDAWKPDTFAVHDAEWSPQIIHDHGVWLPSNHQAAAAARKAGVPLVISPRGMLEPWSLNHRRWKKKLAWTLYQGRDLHSAACLHATSIPEAEQFRKLGLRQPVVVLPNGVTAPEPGQRPPRTADQTRTVLFMSRIHPKKGLPLLIDAWSKLRPTGWQIRIIGPDELNHACEIEAAAAKAGLGREVVIEPAVNDSQKWQVLREADLFVLPTYSENFGIVVAEALASGLPVVTTTGTPWTELNNWQAGWCVEPTVQHLQQALSEAISLSDDERRAMGDRGAKVVRERFSWPAIGQQMLATYRWLLEGGNPPPCVWPAV